MEDVKGVEYFCFQLYKEMSGQVSSRANRLQLRAPVILSYILKKCFVRNNRLLKILSDSLDLILQAKIPAEEKLLAVSPEEGGMLSKTSYKNSSFCVLLLVFTNSLNSAIRDLYFVWHTLVIICSGYLFCYVSLKDIF